MSFENITTESTFDKHPDAAYRIVGGAAVIVTAKNAKVLELNEVGTLIWSQLDGRPVAHIVDSITEQFEVSAEQALEDTVSFIRELGERGLIEAKG